MGVNKCLVATVFFSMYELFAWVVAKIGPKNTGRIIVRIKGIIPLTTKIYSYMELGKETHGIHLLFSFNIKIIFLKKMYYIYRKKIINKKEESGIVYTMNIITYSIT